MAIQKNGQSSLLKRTNIYLKRINLYRRVVQKSAYLADWTSIIKYFECEFQKLQHYSTNKLFTFEDGNNFKLLKPIFTLWLCNCGLV
jgi:hypothetical protein